MPVTRAFVPGLLAGLLAGLMFGAGAGCATAATAGTDGDGGLPDAVHQDRATQQDVPPFDQDATAADDAASDAPAQLDGQHDGPPQHDAVVTTDGGSCVPEADEALGGNTCLLAVDKGSLSDLQSNHLVITGNLWPAGDVDWYKISFVDSPDDSGASDKYNARIAFTATGNPGGAYAFDIIKDDCATAPTCGTAGEVNTALTSFEWNDSGEAPCYADPVNTKPGFQVCVDHSMVLRFRVFRVSGAPVCENYELAVDNG